MTEHPELRAVQLTKFQKVVRMAVSTVIPQKDDEDKEVVSYIERYNCCPPPLFIVIISAIEVCTRLSVRLSVCHSACLYVSVWLFLRTTVYCGAQNFEPSRGICQFPNNFKVFAECCGIQHWGQIWHILVRYRGPWKINCCM